jgi:hypothetical protein
LSFFRVSAQYIALLIYTCFSTYTIQAHSTTNGKIRREIQNTQMIETDPGLQLSHFPQQYTLDEYPNGQAWNKISSKLRN